MAQLDYSALWSPACSKGLAAGEEALESPVIPRFGVATVAETLGARMLWQPDCQMAGGHSDSPGIGVLH